MDPRYHMLLDELKAIRAARNLSQEDLATRIPWSASTIGMIETGARKPPPKFWAAVDRALDTGGALQRLAARLGSPQWLIEWASAEATAVALRSYEALVVPGLLQTEAYARALLDGAAVVGTAEVDDLLTTRLARQSILVKDNPVSLTAVLDEGILHRRVGGPAVMRGQLDALVATRDARHVRLHVVPATVGAYPGLNGPFVLATGPDRAEVGYLDTHLSGQVVDGAGELAALQRAWEAIRSEALSHTQSIELIQEVAEKWI